MHRLNAVVVAGTAAQSRMNDYTDAVDVFDVVQRYFKGGWFLHVTYTTIGERVPIDFELPKIVFNHLEYPDDSVAFTSELEVIYMYAHDGLQDLVLIMQEQQLIVDCTTHHAARILRSASELHRETGRSVIAPCSRLVAM